MGRGTASYELFRSEQYILEDRESDPENPEPWEMWVRNDIKPEYEDADGDVSSGVGVLRMEDENGDLIEAPIIDDEDTIGDDVIDSFRVDVLGDNFPRGTGIVPFTASSNAAYDNPRLYLNGTTYKLHDDPVVGSDIPDSVVSRPDDDSSGTSSNKYGLRISTSQDWPSIGAEISDNVSGTTRAQIYRVSDATLMGETDISGLGPGDSFTVDDVDLSADTDYNFVLDDNGDSYTYGYLFSDTAEYPYTSSDGNLDIIDGAKGEDGTNAAALNLDRVGDVGFD